MASRSLKAHPTTHKEIANVNASPVPCAAIYVPSQQRGRGRGLSTLRNYVMHTMQLHIPHYLLFATDPKLSVDLLLPSDQEDPLTDNAEWLT